MTFDEFTAIAEEELKKLPPYVQNDLNGGVVADTGAYLHPARLADDLYILGTYTTNPIMGKQIVLYYGSFLATLRNASVNTYRRQIRDTIRHEFLHHLETQAGLFGKGSLVEADWKAMGKYFESKGQGEPGEIKENNGTQAEQRK